jgi:glutathione synthase/RimK-type ligase-like ATP-grasp enzyme
MMQTILVLNDNKRKKDLSVKLRDGFEDIYNYFFTKGVVLCRASVTSYDSDKKVFEEAQFFNGNEWLWKKEVVPDIVYDKTRFCLEDEGMILRGEIEKNFVFLNPLGLSELLSDKWLTYLSFKKYCPWTFLIESKKDLSCLDEINADKVVIKPLAGSGGKDVRVMNRKEVVRKKYPFLVQEFIQTEGISGIVDGPHDLRVIIRGDKPYYSFLRVPKKGSCVANLSEGGTIKVLELNKLPETIYEVLDYVSIGLKKFNRKLYSVDFILDNNGKAWMLEMNSRPGITLEKEEQSYRELFYDELLKFLTGK